MYVDCPDEARAATDPHSRRRHWRCWPRRRRRSPAPAPAGAGEDQRPNILVVMTDDMAATDLELMPNVQRLLVKQGTSFTNAVTTFPLCCPSRATFLTGQYAHNHDVIGNFWPFGWYGMRGRDNTLPVWLDRAGYETALIGKWLNGYGARDAHGEVPARLRHLARAARRLRLRLRQLRDEQQRQAEDLGRRRVRAPARRVRRDRGQTPRARARDDLRAAREGLRAAPVRVLGHRPRTRLLPRRHRADHRAGSSPARSARASRSSSGGRWRRRTARTSR